MTKLELQRQLNVSPSKLEAAIEAAGVDPSLSNFNADQVSAIEEVVTQPEPIRPKTVNRNGGLQQRQTASPVKVNQQERNAGIVKARAQTGNKLGQIAGVSEAEAFVDAYTKVTQPFYERFAEVSEAQLLEIEGLETSFDFGDYEGIVNSFFAEGGGSGLVNEPTN
jgi:hypothetical protein